MSPARTLRSAARWLPIGLAACEADPAAVPCGPASGGNVLVVVLDDLGVESVGAYGLHPDPPSTPHLDALASAGVRFDRAYATPLCAPSRAALLTGRYGRRTGLGTNIPFERFDAELPLSERTIAEAAREGRCGYATAAFGKWHLVTRSTPGLLGHPNAQGFDHFDGTLANLMDAWDASDGLVHDHSHWERVVDGAVEHVDGYATTSTVDAALDHLPELPEPWLVQVALPLPHGPLHVPPPSLQRTGVTPEDPDAEQFAAMVEAMDTELGRLLQGVPSGTTVIAVGDNGTERPYVREPWVLAGGKSTLYEGGIRVPLLVAGPVVDSPGRSTEALVHLVDVAATVAALTAGQLGEPSDGASLLPLLSDPSAPGVRDLVYTELFGPPGEPPFSTDRRVVLDHDYKLVRDVVSGEETLHAIGRSPADESGDLLATGAAPEQHRALSAALDDLDRSLDSATRSGCSQSAAGGPGPRWCVAALGALGALGWRPRMADGVTRRAC